VEAAEQLEIAEHREVQYFMIPFSCCYHDPSTAKRKRVLETTVSDQNIESCWFA